jgi:hypothetical protein
MAGINDTKQFRKLTFRYILWSICSYPNNRLPMELQIQMSWSKLRKIIQLLETKRICRRKSCQCSSRPILSESYPLINCLIVLNCVHVLVTKAIIYQLPLFSLPTYNARRTGWGRFNICTWKITKYLQTQLFGLKRWLSSHQIYGIKLPQRGGLYLGMCM